VPEEVPVANTGPVSPFDGGVALAPDAGEALDAGSDGGIDGGLSQRTEPVLPNSSGWTFYGPQHGGPREVWSVSSDEAGNLWVAGGDEGLFLLTPGATRFLRFTHVDGLTPFVDAQGIQLQKVLSVGGAQANTVYVGYEGHFGSLGLNDPTYLLKSGDVDVVQWNGAMLSVRHLDISTGPGVSEWYPNGRDLIRSVYRVVYHRKTGDVWFGGNHGVAVWHALERRTIEHQHAAIYGYNDSGARTMLSGDWYGLGLDAAGDVWFGGGHRTARMQYGADLNFWAPIEPVIDVWPDAQDSDAPPSLRTDDFIQDMAISGSTVVVGSIPNGLARLSSDGGVSYLPREPLLDPKVTALEFDPQDGSLWVGHIWGGITRIRGGAYEHLTEPAFGPDLITSEIPDIQSDFVNGNRRMLVAFRRGAIGIYVGD
jgi:ligand-binding sensor domain-containing protein